MYQCVSVCVFWCETMGVGELYECVSVCLCVCVHIRM